MPAMTSSDRYAARRASRCCRTPRSGGARSATSATSWSANAEQGGRGSGGVHVAVTTRALAAQALTQRLLPAGEVVLPAAERALVLLVDVPQLGEQGGVLLEAAEVAPASGAEGRRRLRRRGGGGLGRAAVGRAPDRRAPGMGGHDPGHGAGQREDEDPDDPAPARHPCDGRLGGAQHVDEAEDSEPVFE